MRKYGVLVLAFLFLVPAFVMASVPITDNVSIDGNMRWRSEVDGKDFNGDTGMDEYQTLRTQIGIKVQASDDVLFRVKFKESRYIGTQGSNKAASTEFQAQEAYFLHKNFLSPALALKVGRFEKISGRKRILGSGGWNINGPRTYDGIQLCWGNDSMKWDFTYARTNSGAAPAEQGAQDHHLFFITGKLLNGMIEPLIFVDWNSDKAGQMDPDLTYTPAVYAKIKQGAIRLDVDAAIQMGKRADKDVFGYLVAADLSYTLDNPMKPKFGLGVDITSGNGYDQDADKDALIKLPFMSRHAFRGYMDYHKDVNQGMIDGIFRFAIKPSKKCTLAIDVHNFMYLTDEYIDPTDDNTAYTQLGQEIDVRYKRNLSKNLGLDCAYCVYMASDDYKPDADMSSFIYLALTAKF